MADTIVNNTPGQSPSGDSGAGWMVAVIVLLAVIVGGFVWYHYHGRVAPAGATNINVTIPTPTGDSTGGGTTQQ